MTDKDETQKLRAEAIELLDRAAQRWDPTPPERDAAALELLKQLDELDDVAGFFVRTPNEVPGGAPSAGRVRLVTFQGSEDAGGAGAKVAVDVRSGQLRVFLYGREPEVLEGLRFSHVRRRIEGAGDDGFLTPVPGEPPRRRSALAVLVQRIVQLLDQARSPSTDGPQFVGGARRW